MKRFFLLLLAITSFCIIFSQNKFQVSYALPGQDFNQLNAIKRVADGYIMVGASGSTSSNLNDLAVMKTDFNMNILWATNIGTTAYDEKIEYLSKCVIFETDGIVILGNTNQPGTRDFLLTKVDYSGGVIWSKSYGFPISGSNYNDNASALCKTSNGYYLTGYLNTSNTGYGLVLKVDNNGVQQWGKYFIPQNGATCNLWGSLNLSTNDLVVSGAYGSAATDAFLIKISASGTILWQKYFAKGNYDNIHDLAEDQGNSLLCAMMHDGYYSAARGALLNIDLASGDVNWAHDIDLDINSDRDGQMCGVMKNPDNTTMISFVYSNLGAGTFKSDIAVAKLDSTGNIIWAKKYGTPDGDAWPKIYPNNDSYLICAEQANNRYPSQYFYLLGLNSDGKSGCSESVLTPVVTTLTGYQWYDFNTSLQTITATVATQSLTTFSIGPDNINKTILCINTGVNEVTTYNPDYRIIPNPAHNEITIFSSTKIESIEIIGILGQTIFTTTNQSRIDISSLPIGTFVIKINHEFYKKFIKE